jgi:hypothetical protein
MIMQNQVLSMILCTLKNPIEAIQGCYQWGIIQEMQGKNFKSLTYIFTHEAFFDYMYKVRIEPTTKFVMHFHFCKDSNKLFVVVQVNDNNRCCSQVVL